MRLARRTVPLALAAASLLATLVGHSGAWAAGAEYVSVLFVDDLRSKVLVQRHNGEQWLLEYGVGCLSLWLYEGRTVVIYSPGIFAGVGSQIIIPDRDQSCRIWYSEPVGGAPALPLLPILPPVPQQETPDNMLPEPAVRTIALFVVGEDAYYRVRKGERLIETFPMDAAPFIADGRTFVPVRYMAESIGVQSINWDEATQTVTLRTEALVVDLRIGKRAIWINGHEQRIDVAPRLRGGRTYLPARYVAEAFGWQVEWDAESQSVGLISP